MADDVNNVQRASHVRSFAKDAALLSGKKPADMKPVVAPPPKQPEPKPVKPVPPPVVPPVPKPVPPPQPVITPPTPPPSPRPPVPPPPKDELKEEILARLREKIAASKPASEAPTPPPVAVPASPPPIILTKESSKKGAPIHTYKSDFSEHVDKQNASVFSVLAAEKDANTQTPEALVAKKKDNKFMVIGGILMLLGLVGVYAAWQWAHDRSIVPMIDTVPSLIFADARKELSGTGTDLMAALAESREEPLPPGNVLITYVSSSTTTEKGIVTFPAPGGALIRNLELPAPDILLRNILDESTVGVIHAGEQTRAFFILRVSSYERTFAGMLEWERLIGRDLAALYPIYIDAVPPVATSTATSTPPAPTPEPRFVDDVVASRDVRALRDHRNRTILLYGYRDKETLIIARDEEAFTQLVERLAATR